MNVIVIVVLASALQVGQQATSRADGAAICPDRASQRVVAAIGLTFCAVRPTESDNVSPEGVVVTEIKTGGVADLAGLKPGDVIYKISDKSISTAGVATERFQLLSRNADLIVNFLREGHPYLAHLRLPAP